MIKNISGFRLFKSLTLGGSVVFLLALTLMVGFQQAQAYTLTRQLEVGSRGADVSAVQTFLASDSSLYPEGLVTGYYGMLTSGAVSRFQTRNGISAVGRIGPITLPVINAQMNGGVGGFDINAPIIRSLSLNTSSTTAAFNWNTNEGAAAVVYYSTSPLVVSEAGVGTQINISGTSLLVTTDMRTSFSATLIGLQSNTTYYYSVYVRDASGNTTLTWPSTFKTSSN